MAIENKIILKSAYVGSPNWDHTQKPCIGILLVNLGTPDAPTPKALRRYLAEFLGDPRVVEIPRLIWMMILHGIILRVRPKKSAKLYESVWINNSNKHNTGSPLLVFSEEVTDALRVMINQKMLEQDYKQTPCKIALGMTYGSPSLETAMSELKNQGATHLMVLPLFPQYSATTTGAVFDGIAKVLQKWRWIPELYMAASYHDNPEYIQACCDHLQKHLPQPMPHVMFSFHGLPQRNLHLGDPYHCQCLKTARLIVEKMQWKPEQWSFGFQSRFGRAVWLQPYTDSVLTERARTYPGESVAVFCPGFTVDCLETLEEIKIQSCEFFQHAGGGQYHYIPALNDSASHIESLATVCMPILEVWQKKLVNSGLDDSTAGHAKTCPYNQLPKQ
ncbi:MAG: ferrochelatase [Pseudomonadota bacterium]